ncbi:MAG: PAS domain S-box protein [Candidatus Sumerlaeia bacterium]|nr:PAS domain S-box protein [Candidatus Sumerlaeia bacterium]
MGKQRKKQVDAQQTIQALRQYLDIAEVIFLCLDTEGRITLINRKGCTLLGYSEADLIGKNWFDTCIPGRLRKDIRRVFEQLLAGDMQAAEFHENPVLTREGRERLIAWHNAVLRDPSGKIEGVFCSGEDITEQREAEHALKMSEQRYRTLFENLPIGLYRNTPGRKGAFIAANSAIARMFGYDTVEEFLQVNVADLYQDPAERKAFADLLAAQGSVTRYELRLKRRDGTPIWGAVTAHAIYDSTGAVDYFDGAIEDITDRKRIEEALRQSEEHYRTLVQNLPVGLYRRTPGPQGRFVTVNPAHLRILGYESEEDLKNARLEDIYVHSEERLRFSAKLMAQGHVEREEIQLRRKDGTPIWVAVTAQVVRNEAGEIEYFDGIIEDITEARVMRQRLEAAAALVSEISPLSDRKEMLDLVIHRAADLLNADFGVFVELDPETGKIGAAYPAKFPLEKIPEGTQVKGQGILGWIAQGHVVFTPDVTREPQFVGYPEWHPKVGPCIGMPLQLLNKVLGIMLLGRERGKEPFADADRNLALTLAHHAAVAIERTRRMEELKTQSISDELTGLYNRRGFLMLAEQQMKVAARAGKGFILLFSDLDGLKWINDNLGHQEGDAALQAAATVLRTTFRESDIVARIGGDEFAAIAVFAPPPTAEMLMARLQENVAAYNQRHANKFTLSLSAGFATYDPHKPCSMDDLLTQADALMYEQKRQRRR